MAIPLAVPIAITAISAFSSYRGAQASNAQKRANAAIATANAATARLEGDLALKSSFKIAKESRRQTAQLIGTQRAAMASTGFAVGEGSFGDLLEGSAVLGELDVATILFEGELIKFRKEKEARSLEKQAKALKGSQQDPLLAGFTGGLQGGASAFARFG